MTIVTRFAPSPTGYLHIGGARTALFNYLYAKRMGGKFLLRIEDTDKERNTPEAVQAIYGGMEWLGLKHDGEVVLQSQREARHVEIAHELVRRRAAYYDFTTPEQMEILKKDWSGAWKLGRFFYDSPYRDTWTDKIPPEEYSYTIRMRAPRGRGSITIEDLVQGSVTVDNDVMDDYVILRSDGSPTYMLAVVVDDHDMGVTHVIRGDDHLNNAFRQIPIYDAMGWDRPTYAHIPLIHGEDGKKLSKRTGAAAVEDYRDELGILPEAMLNYLAKLGWGHGDEEFFSMAQAAEWFDIKDVNKGPARLDKKKLANINGHWIRSKSNYELAYTHVGCWLKAKGILFDEETLIGAMGALKERSADINALRQGTMFLWNARPLALDTPIEGAELHVLYVTAHDYLSMAPWTAEGIKEALDAAAELLNIKLGKVVAPLRMALTGSKISPPITDVMTLLGKDETLARIADVVDKGDTE